VYQTEKLLREQGEKLSAAERSQVEEKLAALKSTLGGSDLEAIKAATEALMTASQEFTQRLYEAAARESQSAAGGASAPADDEVVDAEIVDDEKP
jgi:molecular chaperone DnaK